MEKEPKEEPKHIADMSETELKAIAYDHIVAIERSQMILRQINEELQKRQK